MAQETPPGLTPRPDLTLAHDCKLCHEWGTVVTPDRHHELCPACQHPTNEDINPHLPEETIGPRVRPAVLLVNP
ncbi:hypothetical protein [Streptomyces coeruleorubidus]|uniref:hypothetical protein n=1 Tax=Streptomyces coeruleorubidus TaxID=116188 RepID=UPI00365AB331